MTKIEVLGVNTRVKVEWDRHFCIMGFGDIHLPDLEVTLRGCALARVNGKIIAMPPKVPGVHPGDIGGIKWNSAAPFATMVKDKLLAAYRKLGGEMPPAPVRRDHVTGKPIGPDPFDALAPIDSAVEWRADAVELAEQAASHARRHAGGEQDDTAGLHRMLGCAIEETMQKAGL